MLLRNYYTMAHWINSNSCITYCNLLII